MNISLSSLQRLLHRYTMESTTKPFHLRSVPVEAVPLEQPKGLNIQIDFFFVCLFDDNCLLCF